MAVSTGYTVELRSDYSPYLTRSLLFAAIEIQLRLSKHHAVTTIASTAIDCTEYILHEEPKFEKVTFS